MNENKKKKIAKEARKAAGVAGASAVIGAAVLDPKMTWYRLAERFPYDSPFSQFMFDHGDGWGLYGEIAENPNIGVGLNAAASGIGGLAAYGLLRGAIKGAKKLDKKMFQRKVALHNATNNIKVNNS